MIVLIDNYDSFTFNLYQILAALTEVKVFRNDKVTLEEIREINPEGIVISPGPGRPENAGILLDVVNEFKGKCPILGVCLGHQGIALSFGGKVVSAKEIVHGKRSKVNFKPCTIFDGLNQSEDVMRYHSLIVEKESLPEIMEVVATTEDDEIMAIKHKEYDIYGVQFHPESIYTECGEKIIENFVKEVCVK